MHRKIICTLIGGLLFVGLMAISMLTQQVAAATVGLLARTPVSGTATALAGRPKVGTIILKVSGAPATAWTVVQWQDGLGVWHDVDGWRGDLDDGDGDQKLWAVLGKNFGQGPFRWVVYEKRDGKEWGVSASFFLPRFPGDKVEVSVTKKTK
jgi:hypothetical protein